MLLHANVHFPEQTRELKYPKGSATYAFLLLSKAIPPDVFKVGGPIEERIRSLARKVLKAPVSDLGLLYGWETEYLLIQLDLREVAIRRGDPTLLRLKLSGLRELLEGHHAPGLLIDVASAEIGQLPLQEAQQALAIWRRVEQSFHREPLPYGPPARDREAMHLKASCRLLHHLILAEEWEEARKVARLATGKAGRPADTNGIQALAVLLLAQESLALDPAQTLAALEPLLKRADKTLPLEVAYGNFLAAQAHLARGEHAQAAACIAKAPDLTKGSWDPWGELLDQRIKRFAETIPSK
ncbi:MAG: hypothetical protein JKY65_23640 [Planctomycetes bacterium]|nr:hypothetical protein [Planctomycetota bacterium]